MRDYPKGVLRVYDIGPNKEADRSTIVYDDPGARFTNDGKVLPCVGMSAAPFWPQGICQHREARLGGHLGKLIDFKDLPEDCRKVVLMDLGN